MATTVSRGGTNVLSRRSRVARALGRTGVPRVVLAARRLGGLPRTLTVLVYHRVCPLPGPGGLDPDLVDATPEEFEAQMEALRRHFTVVGLEDVLSAQGGEPARLPPNPLLITFDDGYRDNYQHAFPILQRLGMRAVFFVATDYVTQRKLFWWEKVSLFVRRSPRAALELRRPRSLRLAIDSPQHKASAIRTLNKLIKDERGLALAPFLVELAAAAGVPWSAADERAFAEEWLMTWQEVRALADGGMDIGSHTRSHRVLATLSAEALADELTGSRRELESRLGTSVRAIAYPVGRSVADNAAIRAALTAAGYQIGFTALPGINRPFPVQDPFDLRRMRVSVGTPAHQLAATLAFPALAD